MRSHSRLEILNWTAQKKLVRLQSRAQQTRREIHQKSLWQIEAEIGTITVDLLNTWSNAARSFLISCLIGTKSKQGTHVGPFVATANEQSAINYIMPVLGRKTHEPTWYTPKHVLDLAGSAVLQNEAEIRSALSAGFTVFDDLPQFRNYFTHRNRDTKQKAMRLGPQYGVSANSKPSTILLSVAPGRPVSVLEDWIFEVQLTLDSMCD